MKSQNAIVLEAKKEQYEKHYKNKSLLLRA